MPPDCRYNDTLNDVEEKYAIDGELDGKGVARKRSVIYVWGDEVRCEGDGVKERNVHN